MARRLRNFIQYGPLGNVPGKVPEARARVAARGMLGAMIGGLLAFAELDPVIFEWVSKAFSPLMMALVLKVMAPDFGMGFKSCITLLVGANFAIFIGIVAGALCYVIGGMRFSSYLVVAALFITPFVLALLGSMGKVAKPSTMATFLEPGMAFACAFPLQSLLGSMGPDQPPNDMTNLLQYGVSTIVWFGLTAIIGGFTLFLPFGFGALPARVLIPSHLSDLLSTLARYASIVAVGRGSPGPIPPALDRRRDLRYETLRATAGYRNVIKTAKLERLGGYRGECAAVGASCAAAETCRLAINLQHTANNRICSESTRRLYFRGPFSESIQSVQNLTCRSLFVASVLAADVAGHTQRGMPDTSSTPPPPEPHEVDVGVVREVAEACQASVRSFREKWIAMSAEGGRERSQEVAKELGHDASPPFEEVCRANASILAVVGAADAAAKLAQHTADLAEEMYAVDGLTGYCCPLPGGIGFYNAIGILIGGPSVWCQGIKNGWRFAVRLGLAMGIIGILIAAIPLPSNGIQIEYGTGAVLTAGICMQPIQGAAILKGIHRLIGTIAGALVAIAVLLASQWEWVAMWVWFGVLAFFVVFFNAELQYAGMVFFTTAAYVALLASVPTESHQQTIQDAFVRMLEILVGVLVAGLLSLFIATSKASTSLRKQMMEALSCSAFTFTAMTRALADAAPQGSDAQLHDASTLESMMHFVMGKDSGHKDGGAGEDDGDADEEKDGLTKIPKLSKLRESSWELMGALFYGGDGQPGTADTLQDTRWESRFGTDLGYEILGGLIWLPQGCFPCLTPKRASGKNCLRAIPALNRQMKHSHISVALLEPGFPGGGELLLGDQLVHEALGAQGEGLAAPFREAVSCLKPLLEASGSEEPITQQLLACSGDYDAVDFDYALGRLDEVDRRLDLLLRGAEAGCKKAGGGLMKRGPSPGTLYGGCSHRVAAVLFILQRTTQNLREVINILAGEEDFDVRTLLMPMGFDDSDDNEEETASLVASASGVATSDIDDDAAYGFHKFC